MMFFVPRSFELPRVFVARVLPRRQDSQSLQGRGYQRQCTPLLHQGDHLTNVTMCLSVRMTWKLNRAPVTPFCFSQSAIMNKAKLLIAYTTREADDVTSQTCSTKPIAASCGLIGVTAYHSSF